MVVTIGVVGVEEGKVPGYGVDGGGTGCAPGIKLLVGVC